MKRIKVLLLLVVGMLLLAACGGGTGGTAGKLNIALDGVDAAPVTVTDSSGSEQFNDEVDGSVTINLAAGNYTVSGADTDDASAPSSQSVTVTAGQTASVTLTYTVSGGGNGDGNGDGNGEEPELEPGLHVTLMPFGVRDADTSVTVTPFGSDDVVASDDGAGAIHFDLDAGEYVLTVERDGYGTVEREVEIVDDGVTSVTVTLISDADAGNPSGNISEGDVSFNYLDVNGYPFSSAKETNPEKDVDLLVVQTEDRVCVTVSTGVSNAVVDIDITNTIFNSAAIVADTCADEQELSTSSSNSRSFTADANGDVQFSLFATEAFEYEAIGLPAKIVVSARGADGRADISEFKVWFVNMSHLYFGHGEDADAPRDVVKAAIDAWLANPSSKMDDKVHTGQRWGRDFGAITNIWGATDSNSHFFGTGAAQKQPFDYAFGPFGSGSGFVHQDFGGYVEYELVGGDVDNVEWVSGTDCAVSDDVCRIAGSGQVAELSPVAGLDLTDLPFKVDIQATYVHVVDYGPFTYEFPLKSYTVSKQWVGGFLEVDKHVDQHVLTWYGSDITLDAANLNVGSDYTSTVHVTVTNSSDSPIHNVAVRDAVPAELGVIESSISHGGTYDVSNHVVTWNFNNTPELAEIAVDEVLEFSFDVYARHKPGYCWAGENDANFVVQPGNALPEEGDDADCEPYADPYVVTNGLQANSVSAAGFFEDSVTGPQYVFSYEPVADESDIWVVRPLFELSKTLRSSDLITEGASAFFDVAVAQIDRVANESGYQDVYDLYPWEFDENDTTTGTGHDADTSDARRNPYARDVKVEDYFDVGIDFTNGTDFSGVDGGGINIPSSNLDKDFDWNVITDLPVGTEASSVVTFTGNLTSFEFGEGQFGNFENINIEGHADASGTVAVEDNEALPAWQNCVYLSAPQLNQPGNVEGLWYDDSNLPWGSNVELSTDVSGDSNLPWGSNVELSTDVSGDAPGIGEGGATLPALQDCDAVAVMPAPPTPFVTLTTNGEFDLDGDSWRVDDEGGDLDFDLLFDGYAPGAPFYYVLTAQSSGQADGLDVIVSGALSNNRVRFGGDALLFVGTAGSWSLEETLDLGTSAGSFAFAPVDIPSGEYARIVIPADAKSAGTVWMHAELTYSNAPSWQTLPLTTSEETSVTP